MADAKLIDKLGGTLAVAEAMEETRHAVKKWRIRGVPLIKRSKFRAVAAKQGIELTEAWVWRPANKPMTRRPAA